MMMMVIVVMVVMVMAVMMVMMVMVMVLMMVVVAVFQALRVGVHVGVSSDNHGRAVRGVLGCIPKPGGACANAPCAVLASRWQRQ